MLSALLGLYPDALTADFYHYYGNSPRRLHESGVPLLDIAAMAAHLPPDCATYRAVRPPEPDDIWTLEAQLLAAAVDLLGQSVALSSATFSGKKRAVPPDQIPRPGVRPKREVQSIKGDSFDSIEEFDAWYATQFQTG